MLYASGVRLSSAIVGHVLVFTSRLSASQQDLVHVYFEVYPTQSALYYYSGSLYVDSAKASMSFLLEAYKTTCILSNPLRLNGKM